MDQAVNKSLLAEFNIAADMAERKGELNRLMAQASPSYERAARLLIKEMLFALEIDEQEEHYLERALLVDILINNEEIPEEYAHQLLYLKLAYYLHKKNYDYVLLVLNKLEDPEDRLACSTYEYYKLLFMKVQVLLAQYKYQQAYDKAQSISDIHFQQDYFFSLPLHERDDIINEYLLKKALAAHFCGLPEAYDLFNELLQRPNNDFQLDLSNVNNFIVFGYECVERNKFQEATLIFTNLFNLLSSIENKTESDLNAYDEVKKILILTKSIVSKQILKERLDETEQTDQKSKVFAELINKLNQDHPKQLTPLFEASVTNEGEKSNQKSQNSSSFIGKNNPSI